MGSIGEQVYWAANDNRVDELRRLLEQNPGSANAYKHGSNNGYTALLAACYYGHTESVRLLVAAGADTSVRSRNGYSPGDYAKYGCGPGTWTTGDWQGCQRALGMDVAGGGGGYATAAAGAGGGAGLGTVAGVAYSLSGLATGAPTAAHLAYHAAPVVAAEVATAAAGGNAAVAAVASGACSIQ